MSAFFTSFIRLLPRIATIMLITHTGCAVLPGAQKAPYRYMVDTAIVPSQPELSGLSGGPPRQVAVLVGPTGRKSEFVVNEVMYQPKNAQDLQAFLATYDGTVLRDGTPLVIPEYAKSSLPPASSGWYLIRIDPSRSTLDDLTLNMETGGSHGLHL
ncbi:MAG: hypothetical protein ACREIM_05670, partial [Nitrospiraceae bacterium]